MKTHFKKMQDPNFMGSWDLIKDDGTFREVNVTIQEVKKGKSHNGKEEKTVIIAVLKEFKPMILNATNLKAIARITGKKFIEDWQGKQVGLCVKKERAFGDVCDVLRIKEPVTAVIKEELTPKHTAWDKAKKAIANGQATIEAIEKKYIINPENKALLCEK